MFASEMDSISTCGGGSSGGASESEFPSLYTELTNINNYFSTESSISCPLLSDCHSEPTNPMNATTDKSCTARKTESEGCIYWHFLLFMTQFFVIAFPAAQRSPSSDFGPPS